MEPQVLEVLSFPDHVVLAAGHAALRLQGCPYLQTDYQNTSTTHADVHLLSWLHLYNFFKAWDQLTQCSALLCKSIQSAY